MLDSVDLAILPLLALEALFSILPQFLGLLSHLLELKLLELKLLDIPLHLLNLSDAFLLIKCLLLLGGLRCGGQLDFLEDFLLGKSLRCKLLNVELDLFLF